MALKPPQSDTIEGALRAHPGVRGAAVFLWEPSSGSGRRFVAYVAPNEEYLDRTLAGADDESRRIRKWQKTYELTQLGKEASVEQPDFNILGWNSTYTRLPIPAEEMREWVDSCVQEIAKFEPREVLELGCGAGLLLLRLAGGCRRYVGVEHAAAVVQTLKRQMEQLGGEWNHVEILERSAHEFDGLADDSFDTVIVNSVVQHFPSLEYLLRVLENAVRVVRPGGRIFVGDSRSLPMEGPFAASVELFQTPATASVAELRERIRKRIRLDEQLVLSPALFLALRRGWPKISRVELQPRRGRFDNEMNRYRFNATLHIGETPRERVEPAWSPWSPETTAQSVAGLLEKRAPQSLGLTGVRNKRIARDIRAFTELPTRDGAETVAAFQKKLEGATDSGIDPQDLWSLGEKLGYGVQISWAASREDGAYDVAFYRCGGETPSHSAEVAWPDSPALHEDLSRYANAPTKAVPREKLLQQLREHCETQLPEAMRPAQIILLRAFPDATDGLSDGRPFPSPDGLKF